jgi:hypothetical protein
MSTFYVYYTGPGGCDYTIGCNNSLQKLKATNKTDAEKEIQEEYIHMGEYGIDRVQLLEVAHITDIDVTAIDKRIEQKRRQAEIKRVEAEERAQYEKLHAKFNRKMHG